VKKVRFSWSSGKDSVQYPLEISVGEITKREGFVFADVLSPDILTA